MLLPFGDGRTASLWHLFKLKTLFSMKKQKVKITNKDLFKVVTKNLQAIEWKLKMEKNRNRLNFT